MPPGYRLLTWDDALLDAHAEAKYHSFRNEIDSNVFPCLGDWLGCHRLMQEIRGKQGFLPEATWLIARDRPSPIRLEYCGTIQGIRDYTGMGAIQNLGVTPEHRGRATWDLPAGECPGGISAGRPAAGFLEVTAQNAGAIRLYQRTGLHQGSHGLQSGRGCVFLDARATALVAHDPH